MNYGIETRELPTRASCSPGRLMLDDFERATYASGASVAYRVVGENSLNVVIARTSCIIGRF